jgi:L-amino acid N-acyltransferase YncA
VVSIAPEIRNEFRRKGYAFLASDKAFDIVKGLGYKVAIADVKVDNVASCKLQEKLGFEHVRNYCNKKGNEMRLYLKSL